MWSLATFEHNYRDGAFFESACGLGFDVDEDPVPTVEAIRAACAGIRGLVTTSPGATPDRPRYRLVLFTSRAIDEMEYRRLWSLFASLLGFPVGRAAKDPTRAWFVSREPAEGDFLFEDLPGAPLDVDLALRSTPEEKPSEPPGPVEVIAVAASDVLPLADVVAPHFKDGTTDALSSAIAGTLYRAGVPKGVALAVMERLDAKGVHSDKKPERRARAVETAYRKIPTGALFPGRTRLAALLPSDAVAKVDDILRKAGARRPFALTDSGNAERFAAQHRDRARYVPAWKQWLIWDGTRWRPDDQCAIDLLAKETARSMDAEVAREPDEDKRKRLRVHAAKMESRQGRENMIALARSELAAAPEGFDSDPWLFNARNGTIDLRAGELRPHRREDMITKLARVDFDPNANAPRWEAFLSRVMGGNADLVAFLQRVAGYSLAGVTTEHVLIFSFGEGDNGKGVFHNALANVLGEYASKAPRGLLYESRNERHPTEFADLFGARFVLCPEVKEGQRFDEALVKDLVGEDRVKARRVFEDFWEFKPTHTLFVCGNHKPVVKGNDHGIWRRIRLIPWTVRIPEEEKDRTLLSKLAAEAPGILAWAVRGCVEWQAKGLGQPPAVEAATAAYRKESNPLHDFFGARCSFEDPEAKVSRRDLRAAYEVWCREVGATAVGPRRFAEAMKARGVEDGGTIKDNLKRPVDAWKGIQLI